MRVDLRLPSHEVLAENVVFQFEYCVGSLCFAYSGGCPSKELYVRSLYLLDNPTTVIH